MQTVLLLYPNQLFDIAHLPAVDRIVLVEEPLFFGLDQNRPLRLHKQKIILQRAAMRRYVEEELWPANFQVEYIDLDGFFETGDILDRFKSASKIYIFDPLDNLLSSRLIQAKKDNPDYPEIEFLSSPNFYLSEAEVRQYYQQHLKPNFTDFYQWQRERFNILIGSDYKPMGGHWQHKLGGAALDNDQVLPSFEVFGDNSFVSDAISYCQKHFADNPGSSDFVWPTSRSEAEGWLDNFLAERIKFYAKNYYSLHPTAIWLFHSGIASSLNIGLISPQLVVQKAVQTLNANNVELADAEAFIGGILGWREFVRAEYLMDEPKLSESNVWSANRRMNQNWYLGNTGIDPYDLMITKLDAHAYVHSAECQQIAMSLMLMAEIQPIDCLNWLNELSIDAYQWQSAANLYYSQQFIESKPTGHKLPLLTSQDLIQLGGYKAGVWCDIWDGLYWRFISNHQAKLKQHKSTKILVEALAKQDANRMRIIGYRADDFLNAQTQS